MDIILSVIASIFAATISLLFFLIQNYNKKQKFYIMQKKGGLDSETLGKNQFYISCKDIHLYTSLKSLIIQGTQYIALEKDKTIFGREAGFVDIEIQDNSISKAHFMIFTESDLWYIEDFNSLNGTFVNGKRIRKQRLSPGDCIIAGRINMLFCTTVRQ